MALLYIRHRLPPWKQNRASKGMASSGKSASKESSELAGGIILDSPLTLYTRRPDPRFRFQI